MGFDNFFDEPTFDYKLEKQKFIDNMNMLRDMTVQESVLYKKWFEVNQQKYFDLIPRSRKAKAKIWTPRDIFDKEKTIEDINNIKPTIKLIESENDLNEWTLLRVFCHSMSFDANPGRNLKFLILDEPTGKCLGVTSLGSDVISIRCRDQYIGWSQDNKLKDKKLVNTTIGTCIMSTQPFGYNFLGGKLVASVLTSEYVRKIWKEKYGDTLVGFTTTSLYGSNSMYNNIPYWRKVGSSAGAIAIKPDDSVYKIWHQWLKDNKGDEYKEKTTQKDGVSGPKTGVKQIILNMIFNEIGLKSSEYAHGYKRGVYFSPIYENTKEYLQNKINDSELKLKRKYQNDIEGMLNWWRPKAINRYTKLLDNGNLKSDILFYNKLCGLTWKETKEKFLDEVGR